MGLLVFFLNLIVIRIMGLCHCLFEFEYYQMDSGMGKCLG
jgi:hypothetical protein